MKKIYLLCFILTIACSKKEEKIKDPFMIEEITFNKLGVVFKIIDDVDSAYNYHIGFTHSVDSIYIKKILVPTSDNKFNDNYTWFNKHGQYACWRIIYYDSLFLETGFTNKYPLRSSEKICTYFKTIKIPLPDRDTVYLKLSTIIPYKREEGS